MTAGSESSTFREILQARLRQFVETGQNRGSLNKHEMGQAVRSIYADLGLPPPLTIWCENPYQLMNFPVLTVLMAGADHAVMAQLKKVMRAHVANPLFEGLLRTLADETSQFEVIDRLPPLGASLKDRILQRLDLFEKEIAQQMSEEEKDQVEIEIGKVATYLNWEVDVVSRLVALTQSEVLHHQLICLLSSLPVPFQERSFDHTRTVSVNVRGTWINRPDLRVRPTQVMTAFLSGTPPRSAVVSRLMAYEIKRKLAGASVDHLRPWLDLFLGGFAFQFFQNYCFVCQHPLMFGVDNDMRLHNSEGPAVEFAGLQKLYSWHGTYIPSRLFQHRHSITPWSIDRERNVELRRVMLEIYGMEKYLRTSRARIVHQDKFGILYRKNFSRGEPLVVVAVTNATPEPDGTHRRYMLRVPPTMRSAKEAVAWTFDVDGKTYDPRLES